MSNREDALVGRRILHYEIREEIGCGAMGTVYRARDLRIDTDRALKFFRSGTAYRERTLEYLRREARTQARLSHPNIATLITLEHAPEGDFIVQEYVPGPDLETYLREHDPDEEARLRIVLAVASALGWAHRHGIIHRDVKPANVLMSPEGVIKVTDFGLARAMEQDTLSDSFTTKGTVPYMPPEAFRGEHPGPRGDVWSLGVLAYEVFEGTRPHPGDNFQSVALHILNEPHPSLSRRNEDRFPGLGAWIDRCLAKDPEIRYPDCAQAQSDLLRIARVGGLDTFDWLPCRRLAGWAHCRGGGGHPDRAECPATGPALRPARLGRNRTRGGRHRNQLGSGREKVLLLPGIRCQYRSDHPRG
jgi:serine/threonine protein kinase